MYEDGTEIDLENYSDTLKCKLYFNASVTQKVAL